MDTPMTANGWHRYQEGSLESLLPPEPIPEEVGRRAGTVERAMVFCGALSLVGGAFHYGLGFRAQLLDPMLDRTLLCEYTVEVLQDLGN